MNRNDVEKGRRHGSGTVARCGRFFGMMFVRLFFLVVFALVLAVVVMWLWNLLVPVVFGIGEIGYWQAFGLMILARLVLGTFGMGWGGHRWHAKSHWGDRFRHYQDWCGDMGRGEQAQNTMKWWHNYKEFWHNEGKSAFEEYLKKKKEDRRDKKTKA